MLNKFKRRYIFAGTVDSETIYYDRKLNMPVKAAKHGLIDMEGTSNNGSKIIILISVFTIVGALITIFWPGLNLMSWKYTKYTPILYVAAYPVCGILPSLWLNKILYANIHNVEGATLKELEQALRTNNAIDSLYKKDIKDENGNEMEVDGNEQYVTKWLKKGRIIWYVMAFLMLGAAIYATWSIFNSFFEIDSLIGLPLNNGFEIKIGAGLGVFAAILLLSINNPGRLCTIALKLQKGEIKEGRIN